MKASIGILLTVALLAVMAIVFRHDLLLLGFSLSDGSPPPLLPAETELPSTYWFDDYYTIDEIAPGTYAIGEPRYYQQNYNYLVVGSERAILFDAGPGIRDIIPVAWSLTELPIIFLPSHFHYDHVGNGLEFDERAVVDLPYLRERSEGDMLAFTEMEHLGVAEGFEVPTWKVDHWWKPGDEIDLGDRSVTVLHTPGHSPESISLFDGQNNLILSGDYLYEGELYVFVPGSSMQDYLTTAQSLLATYADTDVYYGAHRTGPPGPPVLARQDLIELEDALQAIRAGEVSGEGAWPARFRVNDNISILADPRFLQDWD